MKIEKTDIVDIDFDKIDIEKVNLINEIIDFVRPLFDELMQNRLEKIREGKKTIKSLKAKFREEKKELIRLRDIHTKKSKVNDLINKIEKIISSPLINDGSLKTEMIILLKSIDKLSEERIDFHIKETSAILKKRLLNR